jgi:hypothetical protein
VEALFTHLKGGFYHDGRFATLSDVVDHYNRCMNLGLSSSEKSDSGSVPAELGVRRTFEFQRKLMNQLPATNGSGAVNTKIGESFSVRCEPRRLPYARS